MKTDKKESLTAEKVIEEARETLFAAKEWVLDDASLLSAYWHDKMGYMEAWVAANWNLVLDKGHDAVEELDELEDLSLLWLVDHANNNPVPLKDCHVAGDKVEAGSYECMACSTVQELSETDELSLCEHCGYGLFSSHEKEA